jgi:hypothetical protein
VPRSARAETSPRGPRGPDLEAAVAVPRPSTVPRAPMARSARRTATARVAAARRPGPAVPAGCGWYRCRRCALRAAPDATPASATSSARPTAPARRRRSSALEGSRARSCATATRRARGHPSSAPTNSRVTSRAPVNKHAGEQRPPAEAAPADFHAQEKARAGRPPCSVGTIAVRQDAARVHNRPRSPAGKAATARRVKAEPADRNLHP